MFVLFTEGGGISDYSTRMFEQGDYVKGMMADATAGSYLFNLDRLVMERLRQVCAERGVGILHRMDAPKDFPMEAQKIIFEKCRAEEMLGMRISSGFMFDPVKSSGLIFVLSDDPEVFRAQHDCSKCDAVNCRMRKTGRNEEKPDEADCDENGTDTAEKEMGDMQRTITVKGKKYIRSTMSVRTDDYGCPDCI